MRLIIGSSYIAKNKILGNIGQMTIISRDFAEFSYHNEDGEWNVANYRREFVEAYFDIIGGKATDSQANKPKKGKRNVRPRPNKNL